MGIRVYAMLQYASSLPNNRAKIFRPETAIDYTIQTSKLQTLQIHKTKALKYIEKHASSIINNEHTTLFPDISCNIQSFQANYSSLESASQGLHMA